MATPNPHTDLLLAAVQPHTPRRLIDAPKMDSELKGSNGFDWKPTVLLVAICAAALAAFAYL